VKAKAERGGGWPAKVGGCVFLFAITLAVFGQTLGFDFVNLDDDLIVFQNPLVTGGLNGRAMAWAFRHFDAHFYTPLTSISHMADWSLFGPHAGGHHFVNVLLHACATAMLFLALARPTGAPWRSLLVAAMFAIHPLHVESVAWVAERKDVLGGLFCMLTLAAYAGYVRRPSRARYAGVAALFAAGLLCKPTLVTLPVALLALDYWPLERFVGGSRRLIMEKIPLFALSVAASVVTVMAEGNAVMPLAQFPLPVRLGNAAVSCAIYVGQLFEPMHLSAFYPLVPDSLAVWKIMLSLAVIVGLTAAAWRWRRAYPYLAAGWCWYLAMLAPVSGVVQIGAFAHADRCTYLPSIGLFIMVVWGAADLCARLPRSRLVSGCVAGLALAEMMFCAAVQVSYWRNSVALWSHAIACDPMNGMAANSLGEALLAEGRADEAFAKFDRAVEIWPEYAEARNNLGLALFQRGRVDEAATEFRKAVELRPDMAETHNGLANVLANQQHLEEAAEQYREALTLKPHLVSALNNYAHLLATAPGPMKDGPRAVELATEAARLREDPVTLRTLAAAYAAAGRYAEATAAGHKAIAMARADGNEEMAAKIRAEVATYEATAAALRK
jgi:Flp pilus assembly protein TadD